MTEATSILSEALPVNGIRLGTACAGIKKPHHRDLVLIEMAQGAAVAAVFTRNAFCAAPVTVAKKHMAMAQPRYLLINTGNANAGTGPDGITGAEQCCRAVAQLMSCREEEVLPFSTGVIGEALPFDKIVAVLPDAANVLQEKGWEDASWGILTTDTRPKRVSRTFKLGDKVITITGMAKGSGMIRPDMATMLAYIATDAQIDPGVLQACLQQAVDCSFNRITVDGDTSTNDACVLMASGKSAVPISAADGSLKEFQETLDAVCTELARNMVRDAEGGTKLINIEVTGGADPAECSEVAYTVAHSPLVKTAFFAADPNWGRILAAVGRAGIRDLDVGRINIFLDETCIVQAGSRSREYSEEKGQAVMDRAEITVRIELGRGSASAHVWTCDFSYDYVRINAEYRT